MKKTAYLAGFLCLLFLVNSCGNETDYDQSLLIGKWKEGANFEKYNGDGTGYTWDEGDDVTEEEAQPFEWTLEKDQLTHIHIMENGVKIPKKQTVTELTSSSFKYKDAYDKSHSFTKVQSK